MASAEQNNSEQVLDPECSNCPAYLHTVQQEIWKASEEQFLYSVNQEKPFVSAIQELGPRLVNNSEVMERRTAESFQEQIEQCHEKVRRMDNASRAHPGIQPQENRKYVEERLEALIVANEVETFQVFERQRLCTSTMQTSDDAGSFH